MTLIKLQKAWGIGLFLQWQQLITGLGASGEFASSIRARRTPYASRFRSRPALFLICQLVIACAATVSNPVHPIDNRFKRLVFILFRRDYIFKMRLIASR